MSTSASTSNPLVPATASTTVPTGATATSVAPPITSTSTAGELSGIFGSGVSGMVGTYLSSLGGTDSAVLQEYISSLQPQMASAQAQTNAALGAGGVSADSSVAAIADANLQAQEQASIAGESAALTQNAEQIEASMIQSMLGPAENYQNAQSMMPWELAGSIIGAGGNIAAAALMARGKGDKDGQ